MIWRLFITFFSIGAVSFGGGYAMIPMIRSMLVQNGYMTIEQVADMVAISQMTPGPFAVNAATFAGMQTAGALGAVSATIGVVTPSLIIAAIVSRYFLKYRQHKLVQGALGGIRPVVVGLVLSATLSMAMSAFFPANAPSILLGRLDITSLALAAGAFLLLQKTRVSPIVTILICGALGVVLFGFV